jgi:hypothetical protein
MRARTERALELMMQFAERTGLTWSAETRSSRRYLWTDAFAVCNFLGLAHELRDERYERLALRLVDDVHHVLGRYREGDPRETRSGWLSGLPDEDGELHPTRGGLRIGKPLPERGPDEPRSDDLEWERDGQYFHYLTKWMHALHQMTLATGQPGFADWARELAHVAHRAFTHAPRGGGSKRMWWKMSVDLSRPVVAAMGQHDPLDGLVTYAELEATRGAVGPSLRDAMGDFASMLDPDALVTGDPLGLGGLLFDAYRVIQLDASGAGLGELAVALTEAALVGVRHYAEQADLRLPAEARLAFRELGLSIGLGAVTRGSWARASDPVRHAAERLHSYAPLCEEIEAFWLAPEHRRSESWLGHEDINAVMLATSLAPEAFLVIAPSAGNGNCGEHARPAPG